MGTGMGRGGIRQTDGRFVSWSEASAVGLQVMVTYVGGLQFQSEERESNQKEKEKRKKEKEKPGRREQDDENENEKWEAGV
jgi:hypothetical protein